MASAQYVGEQLAKPVPTGKGDTAAWREFSQLMIQAAMHPVFLQPEDATELQKKLLDVLENLKGDPGEDKLRKLGPEVAAEVDRHNRATQTAITNTLTELRETVGALSQGLSKLTGQSELTAHIDSLQSIVTTARSSDELHVGRAQVEDLIELIGNKERERAARHDEFVQELQTRIEQLENGNARNGTEAAREVAALAATTDSLTGVPNGVAAREAILNAQSSDRPPLVAVMHIQSLDVLNARFGQRIGDQIVLTCCQHLASNLCRENDRIFRWRGPAFVVLLDRDDSPAGVGREVSHVCNSIASSFFGEPHRSILIPVKLASTTITLESRLITDVFDSIERFIIRAGRPTA